MNDPGSTSDAGLGARTAIPKAPLIGRAAELAKLDEALAEAIGVTRQTVIAIELGKYSPSLESAFRIARVFETDVESVFGWQGPPDA